MSMTLSFINSTIKELTNPVYFYFGSSNPIKVKKIYLSLEFTIPSLQYTNGWVKVPCFVYSGSGAGTPFGDSIELKTWQHWPTGINDQAFTLSSPDLDLPLPAGGLEALISLPSYAIATNSKMILGVEPLADSN